MDLRPITTSVVEQHPLEDLALLLGADAGFVWLDIGEWDEHLGGRSWRSG